MSYIRSNDNDIKEHSYSDITITTNKKYNLEIRYCRTKKYPHILHIYIPEDKQPIIEAAKEVAKRKRLSISRLIVTFLERFVKANHPNNPQLKLSKFLTKSENKLELNKVSKSFLEFLRWLEEPSNKLREDQKERWIAYAKKHLDNPLAKKVLEVLNNKKNKKHCNFSPSQ